MLAARKRVSARPAADVGAGDERLLTRAGEDDGAHRIVPFKSRMTRLARRASPGWRALRTSGSVDRDEGNRVVALEKQVVKGHGGFELYPTPSLPLPAAETQVLAGSAAATRGRFAWTMQDQMRWTPAATEAPMASAENVARTSTWRRGTKY